MTAPGTGGGRAELWAVRDDRKLSARAKLAWVMLWSRRPSIHPSVGLLAADMSVNARTAQRAVRELEAAGLVKVVERLTAAGDPDTNEYLVVAPEGGGGKFVTTPGVESVTRVGANLSPEGSNGSSASVKGAKALASRRARAENRASATRQIPEIISDVRAAVAEVHGEREAVILRDEDAVGLYCHYVGQRQVQDVVAYLAKIFADAPYLDTFIANSGGVCLTCGHWEDDCTC